MKNQNNNNEENRFSGLFAKAKLVRMTQEEKTAGMKKLLAVMDSGILSQNRTARVPSRTMTIFEYVRYHSRISSAISVAVVIILVGGGTVSAAQNSLPGDTLYPVKLNVTEKVQILLATTPQAKAAVNIDLAAKRLSEAEALALSGKLDAEKQKVVEDNFNKQVASIATNVETINSSGDTYSAAEVSSDLESTLNAHRDIIAKISPKVKRSRDNLNRIGDNVNTALAKTAGMRSETEVSAVATDSKNKGKDIAERAKKNAEDTLKTAATALQGSATTLKVSATPSRTATMMAPMAKSIEEEHSAIYNLNQAENDRTEAEVKLNAGNYGDAALLYGRAHRKAQQASLQIKTEKFLEANSTPETDDDTSTTSDANSATTSTSTTNYSSTNSTTTNMNGSSTDNATTSMKNGKDNTASVGDAVKWNNGKGRGNGRDR